QTVWTWNAIGKRRRAWNLSADAPEASRGFLLNHLISELLPGPEDRRYANADPVTGQAAWYDLRVRVRKAAPGEHAASEPQFAALATPPGALTPPAVLRYGERFLPRWSWRRKDRSGNVP
ncbi:MAG TPA: formate dehydrogenase, partial [Gammaproteobacteria bacterium]|nr:formate dehydrogenase [Gammaproteobacteria bacterium]